MRAQRRTRFSVRRITGAMVFLAVAAALCAAQTAPNPPAHTAVKHRKPRAAAKTAAATPPPGPVEPPKPDWPVNDKPVPATISWDSRTLRIQAANSSLLEILANIMSATGTKIEGASNDQRVFGSYGPGPARDVLSDLLRGSGYNILMMGENDLGVPREVVLSQRRNGPLSGPISGGAHPPTPAQQDDDYTQDEPPAPEPEPEPQPPVQPQQPNPQDQRQQQLLQPGQPPVPGQQPPN